MIEHFRRARHDPGLVVLEGFHAIKHALRFGAELLEIVAADPDQVLILGSALAPDLSETLTTRMETISSEAFASLTPRPSRATVMAIARRPRVTLSEILDRASPSPLVLLENPRHLGNVGACIRVAAAAGAAGVLSTGTSDPWHPDAVRGAAGLHFALPVVRVDTPLISDRPLVALDPEGQDLRPEQLPARAILAFGTERSGLSGELLASASQRLRLPMIPGVSSLNLATSVSAVLYALQFTSAASAR